MKWLIIFNLWFPDVYEQSHNVILPDGHTEATCREIGEAWLLQQTNNGLSKHYKYYDISPRHWYDCINIQVPTPPEPVKPFKERLEEIRSIHPSATSMAVPLHTEEVSRLDSKDWVCVTWKNVGDPDTSLHKF